MWAKAIAPYGRSARLVRRVILRTMAPMPRGARVRL